ncbi:MAG: type II/IV secretion system ATPase subunit [Candidatus Methanomethylicia archaeon]
MLKLIKLNFTFNVGRKLSNIVTIRDTMIYPLPENCNVLMDYWVYEPYAKIVIAEDNSGGIKYYVLEDPLTFSERSILDRILSFIVRERDPPKGDVDRIKFVISEAEALMGKYKKLYPSSEASKSKILYYVSRELAGFGPIHPIMLDSNIEDISCNGVGLPIYVYHRNFESLPTNIVFVSEEALDDFIIKLAHLSGKHVSSANPVVDATLPGKHRLAATFMREVSNFGSSFCIRKFRDKPFSIVELISMGTVNEWIAAYLWMIVENKMSVMILGGTGVGKTTMLNAILSLIRPEVKIVTVEETAEINLHHENWVSFVSREELEFSGAKAKSISLFDLVKTSLRYRPDYLIVGEVRGEEAYVLFQALATGHGGMSTMHADNLDYAIKRLTSPPMNISSFYMPLMNVWLHIERMSDLKLNGHGSVRRVRTIWEMDSNGSDIIVAEWVPEGFFHVNFKDSLLLNRLSRKIGLSMNTLLLELENRAHYLNILLNRDVTSHRSVAEAIRNYYKSYGESSKLIEIPPLNNGGE